MQSLADIFKRKSTRSPLLRSVNTAMTVEMANNIIAQLFGEKIIDAARAVYLKNQILSVACLNTVVSQEIKLNEAKIIDLINTKAATVAITKIRYIA
ncbi:MAG: DciA family protein [bacterium]|nr:DciA family protein [bacterium]